MSQRTLPLLFFNLGGEMLYILNLRLHAQNVLTGKTAKVMQDMVETMFGEQWLEELFQPRALFPRDSLVDLLHKVAHSSIMKLSKVAMEKLYDLISMSFKYQLMACPRAEDIILVTLNHLDSLKSLVSASQTCCDSISTASRKLNEVYYDEDGVINHTDQFLPVGKYDTPLRQGSWEMVGDRVITLGLNIYEKDSATKPKQRSVSEVAFERPERRERPSQKIRTREMTEDGQGDVATALVNDELSLLCTLLVPPQQSKPHSTDPNFRLNLFPELELDHEDSLHGNTTASHAGEEVGKRESVVHLETYKKGTEDLEKIRRDFSTSASGPVVDQDDLLDLLDQAVA